MAFYTETYLNKRRVRWLKSISKVEVLVGTAWHTGEIQKKDVNGEKIVIHAVFGDLTDSSCTITSLRVIDVDGEVAAQMPESITTAAGQGVLIKLELPITEKEA